MFKPIINTRYLGLTDQEWLVKMSAYMNQIPKDTEHFDRVQKTFSFLVNRIRFNQKVQEDTFEKVGIKN